MGRWSGENVQSPVAISLPCSQPWNRKGPFTLKPWDATLRDAWQKPKKNLPDFVGGQLFLRLVEQATLPEENMAR
jgi:hypothetical protein